MIGWRSMLCVHPQLNKVGPNLALKGLFVHECAEGSRCSHKMLCVCVWGKVLASGERGFQE